MHATTNTSAVAYDIKVKDEAPGTCVPFRLILQPLFKS